MSLPNTPISNSSSEDKSHPVLDSVDLNAPIPYSDPYDEQPDVLLMLSGFKKFSEVGAVRHNIKQVVFWIVVYFITHTTLSFLCRTTGDWLVALSHITLIVLIFGVISIVAILMLIVTIGPPSWAESTISNANYGGALFLATVIRFTPYGRDFGIHFDGITRSFIANWDKSERVLRKHLRIVNDRSTKSETWICLGNVLIAQKRYQEALDCFENAIRVYPANAEAYSGLTEIYLYQNLNPQRAFGLVERALKVKGRSHHTKFDRYSVAEMLVNKGWAFQLLGDIESANIMIEQALAWANTSFKGVLAGVNFRAGLMMQLCGQYTDAQNYFQKAIQIDPKGGYGKRAHEYFQQLSEQAP